MYVSPSEKEKRHWEVMASNCGDEVLQLCLCDSGGQCLCSGRGGMGFCHDESSLGVEEPKEHKVKKVFFGRT